MDQVEIDNQCQVEQIRAMLSKMYKFRLQKPSEHQGIKHQLSVRWIDMYRALFKLKIFQLHYLCDESQQLKVAQTLQSNKRKENAQDNAKEFSDDSDPEPPYVKDVSSDEIIHEMSGEEDVDDVSDNDGGWPQQPIAKIGVEDYLKDREEI